MIFLVISRLARITPHQTSYALAFLSLSLWSYFGLVACSQPALDRYVDVVAPLQVAFVVLLVAYLWSLPKNIASSTMNPLRTLHS